MKAQIILKNDFHSRFDTSFFHDLNYILYDILICPLIRHSKFYVQEYLSRDLDRREKK